MSHALLTLPKRSRLLTTLRKNPSKNIVGKGENTGEQHFLLFPQCFLPILKRYFNFFNHFYFVICKCFEFGPVSKFCRLVKSKPFPKQQISDSYKPE